MHQAVVADEPEPSINPLEPIQNFHVSFLEPIILHYLPRRAIFNSGDSTGAFMIASQLFSSFMERTKGRPLQESPGNRLESQSGAVRQYQFSVFDLHPAVGIIRNQEISIQVCIIH
jgi:hypothetical protein